MAVVHDYLRLGTPSRKRCASRSILLLLVTSLKGLTGTNSVDLSFSSNDWNAHMKVTCSPVMVQQEHVPVSITSNHEQTMHNADPTGVIFW